jgi:hypothetical protein
MRSKEVEKAIDITKQLQQFIKKGGRKLTFYDNENCVIAYESLGILLSYIEELEKERDGIYADYQDLGKEVCFNFVSKDKIREKIKELEEKRDEYIEENKFGSFMEAESGLRALKSIIEEE